MFLFHRFSMPALPFRSQRLPHSIHSLPLGAARLQIAKRYRIITFFKSHNFIYKPRGILNAQAGECCSAKRKTRSPNARNGRGGHYLYGGGGGGGGEKKKGG